jgi:hypothetical protein
MLVLLPQQMLERLKEFFIIILEARVAVFIDERSEVLCATGPTGQSAGEKHNLASIGKRGHIANSFPDTAFHRFGRRRRRQYVIEASLS